MKFKSMALLMLTMAMPAMADQVSVNNSYMIDWLIMMYLP